MKLYSSKDTKGRFYRGYDGEKYYYPSSNRQERNLAYNKACQSFECGGKLDSVSQLRSPNLYDDTPTLRLIGKRHKGGAQASVHPYGPLPRGESGVYHGGMHIFDGPQPCDYCDSQLDKINAERWRQMKGSGYYDYERMPRNSHSKSKANKRNNMEYYEGLEDVELRRGGTRNLHLIEQRSRHIEPNLFLREYQQNPGYVDVAQIHREDDRLKGKGRQCECECDCKATVKRVQRKKQEKKEEKKEGAGVTGAGATGGKKKEVKKVEKKEVKKVEKKEEKKEGAGATGAGATGGQKKQKRKMSKAQEERAQRLKRSFAEYRRLHPNEKIDRATFAKIVKGCK